MSRLKRGRVYWSNSSYPSMSLSSTAVSAGYVALLELISSCHRLIFVINIYISFAIFLRYFLRSDDSIWLNATAVGNVRPIFGNLDTLSKIIYKVPDFRI